MKKDITDWYSASSELAHRLSLTLDVPLKERLVMPLQDAQEWLQNTIDSTKRAFRNLKRATPQEDTRPRKFNTKKEGAQSREKKV